MLHMNANIIVRQLMSMGLTQREIERRSGVKQCVVSALNTGRYGRRTPYSTLVSLQKVLDAMQMGDEGNVGPPDSNLTV